MPSPPRRILGPAGRRALLGYAFAWAAAGALVAGLLLAALAGRDGGEGTVALPPVRETELVRAAERAGCELRRGSGGDEQPPVDGPRGAPARPGSYDRPLPVPALVGALARGTVVISHRPDLPPERRALLEALQRAVPDGTIVAPNPRMRFLVAISAWRRRLGCRALDARTLDALRLFRGRFLGAGPDSPR